MGEPALATDDHEEYEGVIKEIGEKLPDPRGWRILIAIPKVSKQTEGGIHKPEEVVYREQVGGIVGLVIKLGDLAYKDEKKFPTGAWCGPGDYILMRSYSGTRLIANDQEFRLINDDTVEAVVSDPRGVVKVL